MSPLPPGSYASPLRDVKKKVTREHASQVKNASQLGTLVIGYPALDISLAHRDSAPVVWGDSDAPTVGLTAAQAQPSRRMIGLAPPRGSPSMAFTQANRTSTAAGAAPAQPSRVGKLPM